MEAQKAVWLMEVLEEAISVMENHVGIKLSGSK